MALANPYVMTIEESPALGAHTSERRPDSGSVGHLALLVVYYLKDDDDMDLLALHCERIRRHTHVPYTIYATANRCSPEAKALVVAQPNVVMVDVPDTSYRSSAEHGYYLDALLAAALDGDATHICTLDVDSFPIVDTWVDIVAKQVDRTSQMAGIFRAENGDTALAHPSCIFAARSYFERFSPSFAPFPALSESMRAFLRDSGQSADTGIDLVGKLWAARMTWGRMIRTNRNDPHYLMAGVYADAIFHLGGVGRGKIFRRDLQTSRVHRLSKPLEFLPKWLGGTDKRLQRIRAGAEARMASNNRAIYSLLREWLVTDPESMFAYLLGQTDGSHDPWVQRLESLPPDPESGPRRGMQ